MSGNAYIASCCSSDDPTPPVADSYRQARLISSGALADVWLLASSIPTTPPDFKFYDPVTGFCYKIIASDAASPTPGTILEGWQSVMDAGYYARLCAGGGTPVPTYAQAKGCDYVLMDAWKDLSTITLPYYFITSDGHCGIIDSNSPTDITHGTLLTGEMTTSGCDDPVCFSPTPTPTPPVAPSSLTATAGDASAILSWTASTTTGVEYFLKIATVSGGPYTVILSGSTALTYTVGGLINGTTYYFIVTAVKDGAESVPSNEASATPVGSGGGGGGTPTLPTPLSLYANPLDGDVDLTWNTSVGATGYTVKRALVTGGPYTIIASVSGTSYPDTAVTNGTTYYYVVMATGTGGAFSADSNEASATPNIATTPATPTGLTVTAYDQCAVITWNRSSGASGYNLAMSTTSGGPYTSIGSSLPPDPFVVTTLTNGTTYYFVVTASNTAGTSAASSQVSGTPGALGGIYAGWSWFNQGTSGAYLDGSTLIVTSPAEYSNCFRTFTFAASSATAWTYVFNLSAENYTRDYIVIGAGSANATNPEYMGIGTSNYSGGTFHWQKGNSPTNNLAGSGISLPNADDFKIKFQVASGTFSSYASTDGGVTWASFGPTLSNVPERVGLGMFATVGDSSDVRRSVVRMKSYTFSTP